MKLLVLNGSNLNLLGKRQPDLYGNKTLVDIELEIDDYLKQNKIPVYFDFYQSNHEGKLIDEIHLSNADYMIANFGGYTHTSVSLRDAILGTGIKFVEVHLTNIKERESFRQHSYFTDIADRTFYGHDCYIEAVKYFSKKFKLD